MQTLKILVITQTKDPDQYIVSGDITPKFVRHLNINHIRLRVFKDCFTINGKHIERLIELLNKSSFFDAIEIVEYTKIDDGYEQKNDLTQVEQCWLSLLPSIDKNSLSILRRTMAKKYHSDVSNFDTNKLAKINTLIDDILRLLAN